MVKPSNHVKEQFQTILSQSIDDINVFIYDDDDQDVEWMLSVAVQADVVIIDIDNCDPLTKLFVTFMLSDANTYYITNDETTPYKLISKNRIYNLDWIIEQLKPIDFNEEDEEDGISED
jgi:hypothetical protein